MQNTDPAELRKFEQLAASWWDPAGDSRPLHLLNPIRLSYIERRGQLAPSRVLDVGCGGGLLSESMARAGAHVLGIDAGHAQISVARLHAREQNISVRYEESTVEELIEQRRDPFDVITCMELIEHVPDPNAIVHACAELLRPGGRAFFSPISRTLGAWLKTVVAAEYVLNLLPRGTHRYDKFVRPSELAAWGRTAGLSVNDIAGLQYNPLAESFRLVSNTDANYIMCLQCGTPQ